MKKYQRITAMITLLGGVGVMYYAWHNLKIGSIHVPDAGFMPFLCGAALLILGVVRILILQRTHLPDQGPAEKRLWHKPVLSLVLMLFYAWTFETLGYITSTFIFMVAWQQIIEREKWVKTILISILAPFAMYALFVCLLRVPIPQELFFR